MGVVVWALIIGVILMIGAIPVGPVLGIFGGWFVFSGLKTCRENKGDRDMIVLYSILYFVPGVILIVLAFYAGNNGLLELLM